MEQFTTRLKSGKQIVLTVNTPCGFSLVEGAVIAASAGRYIKILLPGATSPKMDHLPVGTKVAVAMETASGEQLACSGVISDLDERPFIWLKVTEMMPALAKRRHQRVSVNLPLFCSLLDEGGGLTVIYDGKKDNGTYEPADLSLSAGGFKLKTPFKISNETVAVAVFFSPNEKEWMVPVFSQAVYSNPSPTSSSFLTGFRFSMINSRDKLKIDTLVREHLQTNSPAGKIRKYPSCLLRIRNNNAKACHAEA